MSNILNSKKAILLILDGWGINPNEKESAISAFKPAYFNSLLQKYPNSQLQASGQFVGLPKGVMGNSEVGHENIGAGRILKQKLTMISDAIEDGSFLSNKELNKIFNKVKSSPKTKLHIIGLLSEGDVHSHIGHLNALIDWAEKDKLNFFVHPILDGRDDPPQNAISLLENLSRKLQKGKIGSVCGRYWGMDRDNNWDRIQKYWSLLVKGEGLISQNPVSAVKEAYLRGEQKVYAPAELSDEFIQPTKFEGIDGTIKDGDAVIFFNFRPDRARQISIALTQNKFNSFEREPNPKIDYTCLTFYDNAIHSASAGADPEIPIAYREENFPVQDRSDSLGEYISKKGLKQLRIAETEKFRHVTSFFNQGVEEPLTGEERILIPSPKVATYDMKPEMSVFGIAEKMIESINSDKYDLIIANFANADMVGHTGLFDSAKKAIEFVDTAVKQVVEICLEKNIPILITADHGNSDQMTNEDGSVRTAHSTNPVPCLLVSEEHKQIKLNNGSLCDIAPTILKLMQIEKPLPMTGKSLF